MLLVNATAWHAHVEGPWDADSLSNCYEKALCWFSVCMLALVARTRVSAHRYRWPTLVTKVGNSSGDNPFVLINDTLSSYQAIYVSQPSRHAKDQASLSS